MKISLLLIIAMIAFAFSARAADFRSVRLEDGSRKLTVLRSDGTRLVVSKTDGQDSFEKPKISKDHLHLGWLALYPGQGASYSQPLDLIVIDSSGRTGHFWGDFGMVFQWCFAERANVVVYRFEFPHGSTPVGFEMRNLSDHKLIHRFVLEPNTTDVPDVQVLRVKAPTWTRCAQ